MECVASNKIGGMTPMQNAMPNQERKSLKKGKRVELDCTPWYT